MKIIYWNIRGINGRTKHSILQNNIIMEDPNILLLQEMKCAKNIVENLLSKCWKNNNFNYNDSRGDVG
jgi:exonuclease III